MQLAFVRPGCRCAERYAHLQFGVDEGRRLFWKSFQQGKVSRQLQNVYQHALIADPPPAGRLHAFSNPNTPN